MKNSTKTRSSLSPYKQIFAGFSISLFLLACCFSKLAFAANPTVQYMQLAGSTFHPQSTDVTYSYGSGGCIYKTGGMNRIFVHKVLLPHGATVQQLRLSAYDNATDSPNEAIKASFISYNGAGGSTEQTHVWSTNGNGEFSNSFSPEIGYVVDQFAAPINIVVDLSDVDTNSLKFCGVRIAYFAPGSGPMVFQDGFE